MTDREVEEYIAKAIKHYLKENGMKQNILCKVLNCEKSTVSELLNFKRRLGATENYRICKFFNLPLDKFMPKD